MNARLVFTIAFCLAAFGCATPLFPEKTQRERDIEQCTYGTVVPHNIRQRDRAHYIQHVVVPACLRAKGYTDVEVAR
jgi:hypothetical protein